MKKFLKVVLVSILALTLVACGNGTKDTDEPDKGYGGKLVVYSPNSDGEIEGLLYYWGKEYGVEIELQSMGTGEVLSKLQAEKDNPKADVMFGGMNLGVFVNNKDLFQEYVAEGDDKLPEGYQNKTGFFTNYLLSGSNLLVNTDLEKDLGFEIKGYADLLNPALKGKIAMGNAAASSSAFAHLTNMLLVMGDGTYTDDKGWDFVEEFVQNLDGKILDSSSAIYKNTYEGEFVVGVTYEDPSVALITDGAENLRVVYPEEGAVWLPAASAIIAGAPNVDNAKHFLDFLISDEGQKIVAGLTNRPTNITIPNTNKHMIPFEKINIAYEDIQFTADHKEEFQTRWLEILAKYGY
ncbi:MAG: extracellular solute-binding protein [Erysipelothrix sp.]|nr:extracellular solute-binding protein [Erysipelothrix sp.]